MLFHQIVNRYAPLIAFLFGIWYFCIRILGYNLEYIPGDLGDYRFINYLLEHGYRWIVGDVSHFWDGAFMYPFKNTIALSDNMLGTLPIYALFRGFNFSPESSYQLWWICICSLNYWLSYIVFKKWFNRTDIAFILAYVFAFSIFNLGELNYMQMIIRFPIPIAMYASYRLANQVSIKHLFIYSLSVVYQFYCVPYTGFYLFYFSLVFICIYLFISKRFTITIKNYFNRAHWFKTSAIGLGSIILLIILLLPYANMSKTVGLRLYKEVLPYVPQIKSYFMPHPAALPWHFLHNFLKAENEKWWLMTLFPGFLLIGTLVFSIIYFIYNLLCKKEIPMLLKPLVILSTLICALHIRVGDNLSLYALIFKLPGINSMRVPTRFMHFELFILLLILGHFISKLNVKMIMLVFILLLVDNSFDCKNIIRERKEILSQRKTNLIKEIKKYPNIAHKTLALVDSINPAFVSHIDMMLASQNLKLTTFNGYSSYCPNVYGDFFNHCSKAGLDKWLQNQGIKLDEVIIITRTK